MWRTRLNKIIKSVFTKLLIVILITGVCVNLIVGGFFWIHRSWVGRPLQQNIYQYLLYIINDLGDPPSLARARQIADVSYLQIRYDGSDQSWSTAEDFTALPKAHWRSGSENPDVRVGRYRGRHFVEIKHPAGRFIFGLNPRFDADPERIRLVIILLSLLTLILAGAFLFIRWILRPISWLEEGVREVGRGNLKHRVPLKRSDELRDLAEAFNDMTDRIREMLHTKQQLMLDVSHELRSPLTRMKVALEFLPDGQARRSLNTDVLEMEKMINAILETARRHHLHGKLKLQQIHLADFLEKIFTEYRHQAPGVQRDELPAGLKIKVDPEQIQTVFKNIITNALKFSDPTGDPVRISVKRQPGCTVVQVSDSGIGIPGEELPFIFEPFYRVDKSRSKGAGGYGLGLSLCKTIMEAHGGKIEVASEPGKGTTVSLFFAETG